MSFCNGSKFKESKCTGFEKLAKNIVKVLMIALILVAIKKD